MRVLEDDEKRYSAYIESYEWPARCRVKWNTDLNLKDEEATIALSTWTVIVTTDGEPPGALIEWLKLNSPYLWATWESFYNTVEVN